MDEIFRFNCAKFIYQCYNTNSLGNFKKLLHANGNYHNYHTRNKDSLRKPTVRLMRFQNSFIRQGIDIWNELHDSIKYCPTIMSFKSQLKAFMINNH